MYIINPLKKQEGEINVNTNGIQLRQKSNREKNCQKLGNGRKENIIFICDIQRRKIA